MPHAPYFDGGYDQSEIDNANRWRAQEEAEQLREWKLKMQLARPVEESEK